MNNANEHLSAYEKKIRDRLVIDETSPTGLRWNSHAAPQVKGKPAGKVDSHGYWQIGLRLHGKQKCFPAHRIVWFLANGQWPKEQIDHVNCNRSDNRIANLREASRCENMQNRPMSKRNTSSVKGVSFVNRYRKWIAKLQVDGNSIHVGCYTNIYEAEMAIRAAREKLHGEFANHGLHKEIVK